MSRIFDGEYDNHPFFYTFCVALALNLVLLATGATRDFLAIAIWLGLIFLYFFLKAFYVTFCTAKVNKFSVSATVDSIADSAVKSAIRYPVKAVAEILKEK